ncbi:MAG: WxL domain-containing protein [Weissella cibaria]
MKKLVLASLLSVSVLGATSAAFASNTADTTTPSVASNQLTPTSAKTDASVSVKNGDLTLSNVSANDAFGEVKASALLSAKAAGKNTVTLPGQDLSATVTDQTLSHDGWHLNANFSGFSDGSKTLAGALTINDKTVGTADVAVDSADGTKVDAAANGVITNTYSSSYDVPTNAEVGDYTGTINWNLVAGPAK